MPTRRPATLPTLKADHRVLISRGDIEHPWIADEDLKTWVRLALGDRPEPCEVNLRLCNDLEMRRTNARFAGKDYATNVLAFCADDPPLETTPKPAPVPLLLGDILICTEVVDREAQSQRKTRRQHCAHMVTHGVLHLLGYDHQTELEATSMERRETELLAALGFPNPYLPPPP